MPRNDIRFSKGPRPLGLIVKKVLVDLGIEEKILEERACVIWGEVVGKKIAKVTVPETVRRGKLFVRVSTAPWQNELSHLKGTIIKKLNSALGKDTIEDIIFIASDKQASSRLEIRS